MPTPGVQTNISSAPSPRTPPTDSGVAFWVNPVERGSDSDAKKAITSLADYINRFTTTGRSAVFGLLYDAVEGFFRFGGTRLFLQAVRGAGALAASRTLNDSGAASSLVVSANSPGTWANAYKVAVVAGSQAGTYQIQVIDPSNNILENSPDLSTQADAVSWAQNSNYITIALGTSSNPPAVSAAANLAGGTSGAATVDADWQTALDKFGSDLGPGQVSAPGQTTSVRYGQLLGHAAAKGRIALLDGVDSGVANTHTIAAKALRNRPDHGEYYGAYFAPWIVIPGLTPGTTRTIPPSVAAAALMAKSDGRGNSPNIPAAGDNGVLDWALDVSQPNWDSTTRGSLNDASVNPFIVRYGDVKLYGYRTLADPVQNPNYRMLNNARMIQYLTALGNAAAEAFVFAQLDGQRKKVNEFGGVLKGILLPFWSNGSLYGDSADEAFTVNVGSSVNTDATMANGELHAVLGVKVSPFAERVYINIYKAAPTEVLA